MEYQHGGDIYSREIELDYSANINPMGLPPGVREELARCVRGNVCAIYPDNTCRELRKALGRHHGIPSQYIICGNGAADLIFGLAAAVRPLKGLILEPTFSEYEQALNSVGAGADYVIMDEKKDFSPDTEAMCSRIRQAKAEGEPYGMAFLCNPNNPTGIPVPKEEVEILADECERAGTLLVVDECFSGFMEEEEACSAIAAVSRCKNLFLLKAFTKLYAMAGIRLGYGLCGSRQLLETLSQVRQPWSVSGLAQEAGRAALRETGYVETAKALISRERQWLKAELEEMGFKVYHSRANYLFFRQNPAAGGPWAHQDKDRYPKGWLYHKLLEKKVLIRSCSNYPGLDSSYYRICVKTRAENQLLAAHIRAALESDLERV